MLRVLLAWVPVFLVPAGFSALVLMELSDDPAIHIAFFGLAFACAVASIICWWLLALASLATAR